MDVWHWLQHLTGADDPSGHWYTFWSGFGADIGEIALLGAVVGIYRKHNCHVHRCWRIAKQEVLGTSWKVCHKHHPVGRPSAQDVQDHYDTWRSQQDAQNDAQGVAERAMTSGKLDAALDAVVETAEDDD